MKVETIEKMNRIELTDKELSNVLCDITQFVINNAEFTYAKFPTIAKFHAMLHKQYNKK